MSASFDARWCAVRPRCVRSDRLGAVNGPPCRSRCCDAEIALARDAQRVELRNHRVRRGDLAARPNWTARLPRSLQLCSRLTCHDSPRPGRLLDRRGSRGHKGVRTPGPLDALCDASAAMPVAEATPRICVPVGMPTRPPAVRIPRSAPPEPYAGRDVHPDARSRSAPPMRSTPPRVSIGRRQSKSDAERQDESGEKQFHAGVNARPQREFPPGARKFAEAALIFGRA